VAEIGYAPPVALVQGVSRPAWAEVDASAITHNVAVLSALVNPAAFCAVVKAHGYGHGAPTVAKAALAGGATSCAVALVDEGVELRQHGVSGPVLLLSEPDAEATDTVVEHELTPTLYTLEGIERFGGAAASRGLRLAVHVKVDTGMHRVGALPPVVGSLARAVHEHPNLVLQGLWTHLPVADGLAEEDRVFTRRQLAAFDGVVAELAEDGVVAEVLHAANTAGAVAFPESRYGMVRSGLGVYGYLPGPAAATAFRAAGGVALRPAMSLKARVVSLRTLEAGARPSYGRWRPLAERSIVATVPLGYADGVPRALFTSGYCVLIGGVRRPLAGMVTMDQIVVDCGSDASVRLGDEVVLLGRQGEEEITADEWAEHLGTISWEVLCGIGPRVPRLVVDRPQP
jgi:alanine racemase